MSVETDVIWERSDKAVVSPPDVPANGCSPWRYKTFGEHLIGLIEREQNEQTESRGSGMQQEGEPSRGG
jgi:hypothetical protein